MGRSLTAIVFGLALLFALPLSGAKHENWVEVRSANFIVVSNAGEKQARKTAIRFEQIRAVFRQSMAVASAHPSPMITILAVKDEDSMRALLPEYWAKGHAHPAGIFVENLDQYFALIQLDAPGSESLQHDLPRVLPFADASLFSQFAVMGRGGPGGILGKYSGDRFRNENGRSGS